MSKDKKISLDLINDIISKPPSSLDNLIADISILIDIVNKHQDLYSPEIKKWFEDAREILHNIRSIKR